MPWIISLVTVIKAALIRLSSQEGMPIAPKVTNLRIGGRAFMNSYQKSLCLLSTGKQSNLDSSTAKSRLIIARTRW